MLPVPTATNGVPLSELIGKEVSILHYDGRMPLEKIGRPKEIVGGLKLNSTKTKYKVLILLKYRKGFSSYWKYSSEIAITQLNGSFNVDTPEFHSHMLLQSKINDY